MSSGEPAREIRYLYDCSVSTNRENENFDKVLTDKAIDNEKSKFIINHKKRLSVSPRNLEKYRKKETLKPKIFEQINVKACFEVVEPNYQRMCTIGTQILEETQSSIKIQD